jgi:hypothetical protein
MRHCIVLTLTLGLVTSWCSGQPTTMPSAGMSPSEQQMLKRMQDMQSEMQDLRRRLDAVQPATAPLQPLVQNQPHSPPSLNAGYSLDEGFYIRTDDGKFLMHPWLFIQGRDAYNYRSITTDNVHDGENGLELPRAKLIVDGNIVSRDLTYQVIWNSTDTTGNLDLQDAWGRYHIANTIFAVEGGNIRDPVDHEQILFATKSMAPDRSIVNNVLLNGDDIVKGVELSAGYDTPSTVRGEVAFTSGERNFETTFQGYPTNPASWGVAGRVEWKMTGDWKDYAQFTSLDDLHALFVLGAGADYSEGGATAGLTHVVDAQYNLPCGLSLYAAYLGRYVRHDAGSPATDGNPASGAPVFASADTYDATARVMAAYLIGNHFEPFVRYEYLRFDDREFTSPTNNDMSDITLGFNYYFFGHRAKATFGTSYLPQGSPVSNTIGDLLPTHRGQELIVQTQVQLIF